ncbi:hypothetical protein I316_04400 [Kwoniella heveanensis BCC8398]|uniref:RNase III domain-containing protein n=1 Tax=Kwoniella heveanensis BCC8398 TaxID=1296120 RepID=A0A1B9GSR5_9TREE|nr:hypothetical protein I316_04400 [Kwoniella heveanensis BCC8398]
MPAPDLPTFTPSSSSASSNLTSPPSTLTFQNAGMFLTHYAQSIGQQLSFDYQNVFPPDYVTPPPSKRSIKRQKLDEAQEGANAVRKEQKETDNNQPPEGSMRECVVMLPAIGAIRSHAPPGACGWATKHLAKQSACFEAVQALYAKEEVDHEFKPTPSAPKETTACPNETVTTKSKACRNWDQMKESVQHRLPPKSQPGPNGQSGNGIYPCVTTPTFWSTCPPFRPDLIYATILQLQLARPAEDAPKSCRPLVLLTSQPIPVVTGDTELRMRIGDQPDVGASMRTVDCGKMKAWNQEQLGQACRFTEILMRANLQRPLRGDLSKVKWLIVPLTRDFKLSTSPGQGGTKLQRRDIAWDEVKGVADGPLSSPFDIRRDKLHDLARQTEDGMVSNPAEFARRSYIVALRTDLKPSSPHPAHPNSTILDYLLSQHPSLPAPTVPDQPILEIEMVRTPKHGGHALSSALPGSMEISFVLPELVQRHCIPASVFRTASILPHLFNELESTLIAHEMNEAIFSSKLDDILALQAITTPAACSTMEKHYERLEFIGDTLLKLVVTVQSYIGEYKSNSTRPIENTLADRHVLSSNRTLHAQAVKIGLAQYVRNKRFKAKDWLPRDWELVWTEMGDRATSAKASAASSQPILGQHQLGDKTLADLVEALIGASYIPSRDLDDVLAMIHALDLPVKGGHKWSDLAYELPPAVSTPAQPQSTLKGEEKYMKFFKGENRPKKILGYDFKDPSRLDEVLSLDMNIPQRKRAFDRYKMLGNAVLDYFIVEHLWETYPEEGPAALTNMKASRSVEGVRSALSIELGLVDLLRDGDDQTTAQVSKIVKAARTAKRKGDEARSNAIGMEWWAGVPVAATTADPLEAFIGAITHDASLSLVPARKIFDAHILPFLEAYCLPPHSLCAHPKAELIRWLQQRGCNAWSVERFYLGRQTQMPFSKGGKLNGLGTGSGEKEGSKVLLHDQEISRETGVGSIAVKKSCRVALERLRDEGMLEKICVCSTLREGGKRSKAKSNGKAKVKNGGAEAEAAVN